MSAIVALDHLTAGYDGRVILSDVTLSVARGSFVGIVGPNGGGKTTLVKSIVGLLPPMSGSVRFFDARGVETVALNVGYLPQRSDIDTLFPITVEDVVTSGLMSRLGWWRRPSVADRRRVSEVLETTGLSPLRRRPIGALSGGQLQRTLLGRAIVAEPELLVLDEPNSWLDLTFEQQLYDLLQQQNRQSGTTILMVSHELGSLQSLVGQIVHVEGTVTTQK